MTRSSQMIEHYAGRNADPGRELFSAVLGHASSETTQLYALLDDKVADAEVRAARRRRDQAVR